ncbi:MAG: TetR/AcrR family transcriptional regulator [Deltaproteobacteria bacterium]|nr:TetR/AcrR family transcriptional regulator [Deltaproteobacteria bacterium]
MSRRTDSKRPPSRRGPVPPRVPESRPGPPGGKRDANRRQRTQDLCAAGLALFLEQGINPVTIDAIASRAGVAKASFYRYFKDKEELVATLFAPVRDAVLEALDACARALSEAHHAEALLPAYQRLGAGLAQLLPAHRAVVLLYLQEARAPAVGARRPVSELARAIDQRALALTEAARAHALLRPFDPRTSSLAVVGAAERLLLGVLRGEDVGPPLTLPTALASLVLDGLRAPPAAGPR